MFLNICAKYSEKQVKEVHDKSHVKTKISGLNYGEKRWHWKKKTDCLSYSIITDKKSFEKIKACVVYLEQERLLQQVVSQLLTSPFQVTSKGAERHI